MMRVLIVDDSVYMRATIRIVLKKMGCEIVGEAGDGETAINLFKELRPDLITLDNVLPDMMGIDILKTLKSSEVNAKIVMVSAVGHEGMKEQAHSLGAEAYLVKPFEANDLVNIVSEVVNREMV